MIGAHSRGTPARVHRRARCSASSVEGSMTDQIPPYDTQNLRPNKAVSRLLSAAVIAFAFVSLAACNEHDSRKYDISPIFPLSADKCDRYNGKTEGSGI